MIELDRRVALTLGAMLAAVPAFGFTASKPPVVLFVCKAGTAKSAIARELFRKRAKERGIAVAVFSRGLEIEDHVSPPLRQRLDAEGIDTRREGFATLSFRDVSAADMLVAFTPIPTTHRPRKLLDWSAVPSVNDSYVAARADLDSRIEALLDTIVAERAKR